MPRQDALQRIDSHEKLCRIMQKQTHDKIHKIETQINKSDDLHYFFIDRKNLQKQKCYILPIWPKHKGPN